MLISQLCNHCCHFGYDKIQKLAEFTDQKLIGNAKFCALTDIFIIESRFLHQVMHLVYI